MKTAVIAIAALIASGCAQHNAETRIWTGPHPLGGAVFYIRQDEKSPAPVEFSIGAGVSTIKVDGVSASASGIENGWVEASTSRGVTIRVKEGAIILLEDDGSLRALASEEQLRRILNEK